MCVYSQIQLRQPITTKTMRIKSIVITFCLLLTVSFSGNLQAQENLDTLRKKHEKSGQQTKQVINQNGKKRVNESLKITITNDKETVNEFLEAYYKDSDEAQRAMIKNNPLEKDLILEINGTLIRYQIQVNDEANAIISYTKRENTDFLSNIDSETKKVLEESSKELAKANKEAMDAAAKASKETAKAYELSMKEREREMQVAMKTSDENLKTYEESIKKIEEALKSAENMKKVKIRIPKGSHLIINGEKVYANQARNLGYSIEEF